MRALRRLLPPVAALLALAAAVLVPSGDPARTERTNAVATPPSQVADARAATAEPTAAAVPSAASATAASLREADRRKVCAAFRAWLRLPADRRASSAERGRRLAEARRDAMRHWLAADPDAALAERLTLAEWLGLPESLRALVERPVSEVADIRIRPNCTETSPDARPALTIILPAGRLSGPATAVWSGRSSKRGIAVDGIALDGRIALSASPVLPVPPDALPAARSAFPESARGRICPVTGQPAGDDAAALIAGSLVYFSTPAARDEVARLFALAADEPGPRNADPVAARLADGGGFVPGEVEGEIVRLASAWTESPKSVLGIVLRFSGREEPVAPADFLLSLTDVAGWLDQSSSGLTTLMPVVPPQSFVLPRSAFSYYSLEDGEDDLAADAEALARGAGYEPDDFDIRIFLFPETSFDWAGLALVGGEHQWLNGEWNPGIVAHETGHNYGLYHASAWNANDGTIVTFTGTGSPGSPQHDEYGNPFTVMGESGSYPAGEYDQQAKAYLNWISASQVAVVSAPGTYRLFRFDHPAAGANPLLALKLARGSSHTYWVGYRRRFADPAMRNGVTVLWSYTGSRTRLLDMTPDSLPPSRDLQDAALTIGRTFSDPTGNLYITPVATGGSSPNEWIDVTVAFTQPGNRPPTVSIVPPATPAGARTLLTFSAVVDDPDGDPLTRQWDFGDGIVSTDPSPAVSFPLGGERTVTLTVSDGRGGSATDSVTLYLNDPLLLWADESPYPDNPPDFVAAAFGGDRVAAVTARRSVVTAVAPPGQAARSWSEHELDFTPASIAWNNGVFVAVGAKYDSGDGRWHAAAAASSDGTTWPAASVLPYLSLTAVAARPAGFVAVGESPTILLSADGRDWPKLVSAPANALLSGVAFAGQTGIAVGSGEVFLRSTNGGDSWQDRSGLDGLDGWYWTGAASAGGRLFAWDGVDLYSASGDFSAWSAADEFPADIAIAGIATCDGNWVAAAARNQPASEDLPAMLLVSTNGVDWGSVSPAWPAAPVALVDCGGTLRVFGRAGMVLRHSPTPPAPALVAIPSAVSAYRSAGRPANPLTVHLAGTTENPLAWSVASADPWLVPAVSSGVVRLTPVALDLRIDTASLAVGDHPTTLTFSAGGADPLVVPVTLTVFEDDHGNSTAEATPAAPQGELDGRIEAAGDTDWFAIAINRRGRLVVRTTGTLDTVGRLVDRFGTVVATNDDPADSDDRNFLIDSDVRPGTWSVAVSAWAQLTGDYRLIVSFLPTGPPFRIASSRIAANENFELTCPTEPGLTYRVQSATSPEGPWTDVPGTDITAESDLTTFSAAIPVPVPARYFVRVATVP